VLKNYAATLEKSFGFLVAFAIVFFSFNHRWSMASALVAMLVGLLAVWATQSNVSNAQKLLLKKSYVVILIFLGVIVFFLWYHDSKLRYFDNYSRLLIFSPLVYFVARINVPFKLYLIAIAIAGVSVFLQAITYSDDWGGRAVLVYENALSMSNVAGQLLVIVAAVILFSKKRIRAYSLAWGFLAAFLFVTILMTGTKGVWLTVITIIVLALFKLDSVVKRSGLAVLLLVSIFIVNTATDNMLTKRIDSAVDGFSCVLFEDDRFKCQDGSVGVRAWMLFFVADHFLESPILGHGAQTFTIEFEKAAIQGEIPSKFARIDNPHNDFAKILYDFGLLGFGALLTLFGYCFWIAKQVIASNKGGENIWGYAILLHTTFAMELGLTQSNFSVASQSYHFAFFTFLLLGLAIKSVSTSMPAGQISMRK